MQYKYIFMLQWHEWFRTSKYFDFLYEVCSSIKTLSRINEHKRFKTIHNNTLCGSDAFAYDTRWEIMRYALIFHCHISRWQWLQLNFFFLFNSNKTKLEENMVKHRRLEFSMVNFHIAMTKSNFIFKILLLNGFIFIHSL